MNSTVYLNILPILPKATLHSLSLRTIDALEVVNNNKVLLDKIREDFLLTIPSYYHENWYNVYALLHNKGVTHLLLSSNVSLVKIAIDNGYDYTYHNNFPLRYAAGNGHTDVVKLLLKYSNTNPQDMNSQALQLATENGHVDVVKLLLSM